MNWFVKTFFIAIGLMSQYDITRGIEAYDGSATLVGSPHYGTDFATDRDHPELHHGHRCNTA